MRYLTRGLAISLLVLACACHPRQLRKEIPDDGSFALLVTEVDKIKFPVPQALLVDQAASDGGDELKYMGLDRRVTDLPRFKEGLNAYISGSPERPLAVIFWVSSDVATYYVPFSGIDTIDRRRRLTKLGDRFYRIESNRSSLGV